MPPKVRKGQGVKATRRTKPKKLSKRAGGLATWPTVEQALSHLDFVESSVLEPDPIIREPFNTAPERLQLQVKPDLIQTPNSAVVSHFVEPGGPRPNIQPNGAGYPPGQQGAGYAGYPHGPFPGQAQTGPFPGVTQGVTQAPYPSVPFQGVAQGVTQGPSNPGPYPGPSNAGPYQGSSNSGPHSGSTNTVPYQGQGYPAAAQPHVGYPTQGQGPVYAGYPPTLSSGYPFGVSPGSGPGLVTPQNVGYPGSAPPNPWSQVLPQGTTYFGAPQGLGYPGSTPGPQYGSGGNMFQNGEFNPQQFAAPTSALRGEPQNWNAPQPSEPLYWADGLGAPRNKPSVSPPTQGLFKAAQPTNDEVGTTRAPNMLDVPTHSEARGSSSTQSSEVSSQPKRDRWSNIQNTPGPTSRNQELQVSSEVPSQTDTKNHDSDSDGEESFQDAQPDTKNSWVMGVVGDETKKDVKATFMKDWQTQTTTLEELLRRHLNVIFQARVFSNQDYTRYLTARDRLNRIASALGVTLPQIKPDEEKTFSFVTFRDYEHLKNNAFAGTQRVAMGLGSYWYNMQITKLLNNLELNQQEKLTAFCALFSYIMGSTSSADVSQNLGAFSINKLGYRKHYVLGLLFFLLVVHQVGLIQNNQELNGIPNCSQ
jgi:hypothetical protein